MAKVANRLTVAQSMKLNRPVTLCLHFRGHMWPGRLKTPHKRVVFYTHAPANDNAFSTRYKYWEMIYWYQRMMLEKTLTVAQSKERNYD